MSSTTAAPSGATSAKRPTLCLVDASSYLFRAYYAIAPLSNSKGTPTHVVMGFTNMLLKMLSQAKPDYVDVVWDTGKGSFRDEKYSEYKANRDKAPEDLTIQIPFVHTIVEHLGLHQSMKEGYEADDIIATWAKRMAATHDVLIISSDKDLTQLVNEHVTMWDTMRDRKFTPEVVREKYGVMPERMRDLLALTGDSSDNIPGVKGVGPKTAMSLLDRFGSIKNIYANIETLGEGREKKLLTEGRDGAFLSYDLVGLEENVPLEAQINDLKPQPHRYEPLKSLLEELELKGILARLKPGNLDSVPGMETSPASQTVETPSVERTRPPVTPRLLEKAVASDSLKTLWVNDLSQIKITQQATVLIRNQDAVVKSDSIVYVVPFQSGWSARTILKQLKTKLETAGVEFVSFQTKKLLHDILNEGIGLKAAFHDVALMAFVADSSSKIEFSRLCEQVLSRAVPSFGLGKESNEQESFILSESQAVESAVIHIQALEDLEKHYREVLQAQQTWPLYQNIELPLTYLLADIEVRGIKVDRSFLQQFQKQLERESLDIEKEIYDLAGMKFLIQSPKQLADVLFGKLNLPPQRKTKTGFSTDVDVLETLAPMHPLPRQILNYREVMKLKSTYVDALLELADTEDRVHTTFHQMVAVTGRLSSSDPNLQNIPIRTEKGRLIRNAFKAEDGNDFVIADYSQIELRLMAHFSEDPRMIEAFSQGEDIHKQTASEVFSKKLSEVSKDERRIAKAINFGLIYGQTPFGLSQQLGIPQSEARHYIDRYFATYGRVRACMDQLIAQARVKGYAESLLGRRRFLPDLRSRNRGLMQFAERNAINMPLQSTAADIIKKAMNELSLEFKQNNFKASIVLQVHDELIVECPESESQRVSEIMKRVMESTFTLRVPLVVDVQTGAHWGMKE